MGRRSSPRQDQSVSIHAPAWGATKISWACSSWETGKQIAAWTNERIAHPEQFPDLEHTIHQNFGNAAGRIVATILHKASKHESTGERIDDVRANAGTPLRNPVKQRTRAKITYRNWCCVKM